jgi:hypothetical protein
MDIELTPDSNDINIDDVINKIKSFSQYRNLDIYYENYNIITSIKIPENIKLIGIIKCEPFELFLWLETKNNILLAGLQNMPIKSWYKIKKDSEIKLLIDYFTNRDKVYYNTNRFYLNCGYDFSTLINYIKNSEYTNKHIFLDERDEVDKISNEKMSEIDIANLSNILAKSDIDEFYVYTKYSYSKIRFENHKGFIIVELNYNPLKLRNRFDPFDKFLPIDISLLLNVFEMKSINDILDKKDLTNFEIDICVLLAKDKKNLIKLRNKLTETKKTHPDVSEYIDNVIDRIKSDETFIQMENDGIFRSFENSVDILLKTVYERFNEIKCNDNKCNDNKSQDFTYINEILKYKVNNIFYSRLL